MSTNPIPISRPSLLMRLIRSRESGVFLALVILFALLSLIRFYSFLTPLNLSNLSVQIAFTAISAIGVLFVILTGGVDLSVGSTEGVSGFMCAMAVVAMPQHPILGIFIGLLAGMATGALVGAVNGSIIAYIRVTPFIVTLGMLGIARSVVYVCAKYIVGKGKSDEPVLNIPELFVNIGSGTTLGVPNPIIVLAIVALIAHLVLTYTVFGRRLYAVGGNEEATHLSGINVKRVKFLSYVICSAICGITGVLSVARFNQGAIEGGAGHELNAIAAAVIGGTSLMGGSGTVVGVLLGACIMGVVSNGLDLLGIPAELKPGIIGAVIVAAAIIDVVRARRRA